MWQSKHRRSKGRPQEVESQGIRRPTVGRGFGGNQSGPLVTRSRFEQIGHDSPGCWEEGRNSCISTLRLSSMARTLGIRAQFVD